MPLCVKDGRLDLDAHSALAASARPGPWQWYGNTKTHQVYLATLYGGRHLVLDFARWGMRGAQPRFQMLGRSEHPMGPKFEVPYRRDFSGIGHPDAAHIAANDPTTTLALIARIRELEQALLGAADNIESEGHSRQDIRDLVAKGVAL